MNRQSLVLVVLPVCLAFVAAPQAHAQVRSMPNPAKSLPVRGVSPFVGVGIEVLKDVAKVVVVELAKRVWNGLFGDKTPPAKAAGTLEANRDQPGEWEACVFEELQNGYVAIRYHTGYLSALHGGGQGVVADRQTVKAWERWKVLMHEDKKVSFVSNDGFYLCAEEGGGRELNASRAKCGEWEKFTLEKTSSGEKTVFFIRSSKGLYLSAQPH
jgi:hypothetical protein